MSTNAASYMFNTALLVDAIMIDTSLALLSLTLRDGHWCGEFYKEGLDTNICFEESSVTSMVQDNQVLTDSPKYQSVIRCLNERYAA